MRRWTCLLAALVLLSACGAMEDATGIRDPFGVPQPFRGEGDPVIVAEVLSERAVNIGKIEGLAPDGEATLRRAIAKAAEAADVLAAADVTLAGALLLSGKQTGPDAFQFVLSDGGAPVKDYDVSGPPEAVAAQLAGALAATLGRSGSAPQATDEIAAPVKVTLRKVEASPARLAGALQRAALAALTRQGFDTDGGDDTYAISVSLTLGPNQGGLHGIKIVWKALAPDGAVLSEAVQENTLDAESVNRYWPDQAAMAAAAAIEPLAALILRHSENAKR